MISKILENLGLTGKNKGISIVNSSTKKEAGRVWIINPTNGEDIASIKGDSSEDYKLLMKKSLDAFAKWHKSSFSFRRSIFKELAVAIKDNTDKLSKLITLETGKPLMESVNEINSLFEVIDLVISQSELIRTKRYQSSINNRSIYDRWHPYGVIGVITAFNFPVSVWAWSAFVAVMSGNVVIWKPSPKASLSAIAINKICTEVLRQYKFEEVFNCLISKDNEITRALLSDRNVPVVAFTGSTRIGKYINKIVGKRFGKTILELGGNNAVIIDKTANLKIALREVVKDATLTSGQRCTTTRRLFIHKDFYQEALIDLIRRYEAIKIGEPLNLENTMGPLIDKQALYHYLETIEQIKKSGGNIIFGGKRLVSKGYYVEPTLVTGLNYKDPIVMKETFAPILYIIPFDSISDAIKMQNSVRQGLISSIFTNDQKNINLFLSTLGSDCGVANINAGTTAIEICCPFGGEKDSGSGRAMGADAWKNYMRRQTNVVDVVSS